MLFRTREWLVHFDCRWPASHPTCSTNCNRLADARWPWRNKETKKQHTERNNKTCKTKHSTTTTNIQQQQQKYRLIEEEQLKNKKNICTTLPTVEMLPPRCRNLGWRCTAPPVKDWNHEGKHRSFMIVLVIAVNTQNQNQKKIHSDIRTSPKSDPAFV